MADHTAHRTRFELSSQAPFLRDHRAGPHAILPTVMSIEAMAEAAVATSPGLLVQSIEHLTKRGPVLVRDGELRTIEIETEPTSDDRLLCRLISDPDGDRTTHDQATLVLGGTLPAPPEARLRPLTDQLGPVLTSETLYDLFFHGPAFRVIGSARLWQDRLVADLTENLPALGENGTQATVDPHLLELCLQASGVLELVRTGQMRIPRSIDSIVRYRWVTEGRGLHAIVAEHPQLDAADTAYDAMLVDRDGVVLLEVLGYRTDPFELPTNKRALAAVVEALRLTSQGP